MAQYRVLANVSKRNADGSNTSRQLPTFELNSEIQGIVTAEHACRIARSIVDPWAEFAVMLYAVNLSNADDAHSSMFRMP